MYKPHMSHITCTKAEFDAMRSHPASTIYFLYDTSQIFKGEQEFCPSGGDSGYFTVNYIDGDEGITCDKSYTEIKDAIDSGKPILATFADSFLTLTEIDSYNDYKIKFINTYLGDSHTQLNVMELTHKSDDTLDFWEGYTTLREL